MIKKILGVLFMAFVFLGTAQATYASNFLWPVSGAIITTHYSSWHPGVDLAVPYGTPVYAAKGGTIQYAGWDDTGYGNRIDIDDGTDMERYGHLSTIALWSGYVSEGQYIGTVGCTGNCTGPHLHFEIHYDPWVEAVDPLLTLP